MASPFPIIRWTPIALGIALAFGPTLAAAQVSPASGGTQVTAALNGVPLVNIVAPNGAGVSHNLYNQFNVGTNGLILNNASQAVVTQLGGAIAPNPNFHGSSASLILNEVVQSNPSSLNGFIEVGGATADVIIANTSGITCGGCGFLNTPRVTLTTGTPMLDGSGGLAGFAVRGGAITITGAGLDGTNQNYFDILSRAIHVNGQINAKDLQLVGGAEDFTYATRNAAAVAGGGGAPQYAIDSSALGGMYADRIRLLATENGVGVRLLGNVAASSADLALTSAGDIVLQDRMSAVGNVAVAYTGTATGPGAISISDGSSPSTLGAGGNLLISGGVGGISLSGAMLGGNGNTTISAASLTDTGGTGAVRFAGKDLTLTTTGATSIAGASWNGGDALSMTAGTFTLASGAEASSATSGVASGAVTLSTSGSLAVAGSVAGTSVSISSTNNEVAVGGAVDATGNVVVAANLSTLLSGKIVAGGAITIEGASSTVDQLTVLNGAVVNAKGALTIEGNNGSNALFVTNDAGGSLAGGTIVVTGSTVNNLGTIQGVSGTTLNVGNFTNALGATLIGSTAAAATTIAASSIANQGLIQSKGDLTLTSTSDITNSGNILSGGNLSLSVGRPTFDNSGVIQSGAVLTINQPALAVTNDLGATIEGASLALTTASISNSGVIQGDLSSTLTTGSFTNVGSSSTLVASAGGTTPSVLSAGNWNNSGVIYSVAPLTIDVTTALTNQSTGAIVGSSTLAITGTNSTISTVHNAGGGLIYGGTSLTISNFRSITNSLNWIANPDQSDPLETQIAQIGEIQSSGHLTLAADVNVGSINNSGFLDGDLGVTITAAQFNNTTIAPALAPSAASVAAGGLSYGYVPNSATHPFGAQSTPNFVATLGTIAPELLWTQNFTGGSSPENLAEPIVQAYFIGGHNGVVFTDQFFSTPQLGFLTGSNAFNPAALVDFNYNDIYRAWSGQVYQGNVYDATPVQAHVISVGGDININIGAGLGASTNTGGIIEAGRNITIGLATASPASFVNSTITALNLPVYNAEGIEGWAPGAFDAVGPTGTINTSNTSPSYVLVNQMVTQPTLTSANPVGNVDVVMVGSTIQSVGNFTAASGVSLTNTTGTQGTINGSGARGKSVSPGSSAPLSGPVSIAGLSLILPTNPNGLFVLDQAPNAQYLIESNPRYTTLLNPGLGSNFLITQLGLDPNTTEERLGDPNYEDFLVQQEVSQQTGLALIDGASNSANQMQDLMTNAVWESRHVNLTLGVALTPAQVNALQEDIVWMVSTVVDGHTVLAPVVYLASATRAASTMTAEITATNIAVAGANTFTNSGGIITASKDLSVKATGNIANTDGQISGGNVSLTTSGGDISNTTTAARYGDSANFTDVAGQQASINSSGNLNLAATTGSITSTASNIAAGGNASLSAGRDVTLQNQTLETQTTTQTSSGNWLTGEHSTTIVTTTQTSEGSTLSAGGNLTINAHNNVNLTGSQAAAGGDVTVGAQAINVANATTTDSQTVHSSSSGFGASGMSVGYSSTTSDSSTTATNVIASSITGRGNVTLNGAQSVTVTGSDVAAGRDLNVNTANLTTNAAQNTVTSTSSSSGWGVSLSVAADTNHEALGISGAGTNSSANSNSSDARVSTLSSNGNMNLNAQGGSISQQGTQVFAGGNFTQSANTINYTAAQSTNSSSSSSQTIGAGISSGANYNVGSAAQSVQSFQIPGVGAPSVMASATGGESQSSSNSSGSTATVASITARGNVTSTSSGATTFEGTQIQAGGSATIGAASLNVSAAQNTSNSSNSSSSSSGGIQGGFDISGKPMGGAEGGYSSANGSQSSTTAVTGTIRSNTGPQSQRAATRRLPVPRSPAVAIRRLLPEATSISMRRRTPRVRRTAHRPTPVQ